MIGQDLHVNLVNPVQLYSRLETEPNTELRLEGNSDWLRKTSGAKEVDWLAEVRRFRHVLELISEVARVEDVEGFEEEPESFVLAKPEELRDAHVQLREAVATFTV